MPLHQTIKDQIKEAMRARDRIRLDTLRGLDALFQNEIIMGKVPAGTAFLPDDKALPLVKRSVNQHKDSIKQFEAGNRADLVEKEKAELAIIEQFLPAMMSLTEIEKIVSAKLDELKKQGPVDAKSIGKLTGLVMKETAGKADGGEVKAVIEKLLAK